MSQSPFGLAPVKRVGCSRSPGPASTQQKTNPGKLGPHAAPNSMLSRTSARFPLFSSQVKTTTTQRFGLGSYHLAFTGLVCAVDKPILHHDGSPALAFQRLVRANFVWRDIPVLSALALVRHSAIGHTGILLPLGEATGLSDLSLPALPAYMAEAVFIVADAIRQLMQSVHHMVVTTSK